MPKRPPDLHDAPEGLAQDDPQTVAGQPSVSIVIAQVPDRHDRQTSPHRSGPSPQEGWSAPSRDGRGRPDHADHHGAVPLLALELTTIEKARESSTSTEDSNPSAMRSPLLGTIYTSPDIAKSLA